MKLKEIKNYVTDGEYSVSMGIKYLVERIGDWVVEDNLEVNSDFQRGHVWTESQQIEWVEYFLMGGKSGRTLYFNAAWWGDFDKSKFEYIDFVLVDGLQRLTAIKRFVADNLPIFDGYYISDFEDSLKRRVLRYNLTININSLRSKREVLTWYIQMNAGGTPHTQAEIDKVEALLNAEKLIGGL